MTKRLNEQMTPEQLKNIKATGYTDLNSIASKLAANAIMSESAIVIELPLPPSALSPNSRQHWGAKARAVNQYRTLAKFSALPHRPQKPHAAMNYFFIFKLPCKQDKDNLIASMKAALDGLQDAGIIGNDSNLHPTGCELFTGKAHEPYGVRIILWERVNNGK